MQLGFPESKDSNHLNNAKALPLLALELSTNDDETFVSGVRQTSISIYLLIRADRVDSEMVTVIEFRHSPDLQNLEVNSDKKSERSTRSFFNPKTRTMT